MTTKFLFTFFIANDRENCGNPDSFGNFDNIFDKKDPENNAAMVKQNSGEALASLEKIGHYYDTGRERIVFFGIAASREIINVIDDQAILTGQSQVDQTNRNTKAGKFINDICSSLIEKFGLANDRCTWVVVPLDELAAGYGKLFVEGMAGESGNG